MVRSSCGRLSCMRFIKSRNLVSVRAVVAICCRKLAMMDYTRRERGLRRRRLGRYDDYTCDSELPGPESARDAGFPGRLSKSSRTFRREKFSAFVHTETTPLTTVSLLHSCRGESFDVAGVGKRFVRADRLRLDRFFEECGRQNRPFGARFCDAGRDE